MFRWLGGTIRSHTPPPHPPPPLPTGKNDRFLGELTSPGRRLYYVLVLRSKEEGLNKLASWVWSVERGMDLLSRPRAEGRKGGKSQCQKSRGHSVTEAGQLLSRWTSVRSFKERGVPMQPG